MDFHRNKRSSFPKGNCSITTGDEREIKAIGEDGDRERWRSGKMAIGKDGDRERRRSGKMAIGKDGDRERRRSGKMAIGKDGDQE
ncbi:MAG: hypothetical protein AB4426_10415 [Xenococcaceae cyanobacterium]